MFHYSLWKTENIFFFYSYILWWAKGLCGLKFGILVSSRLDFQESVKAILAITYSLFYHLCFCFTNMEQIKDRCSKENICPALINLCYCKCNKSFPNSAKCKINKWKRKEKKEGNVIKKFPTFKKEMIIWAPPHASKYFTTWLDDQAMTWSLLTWLTVREGDAPLWIAFGRL